VSDQMSLRQEVQALIREMDQDETGLTPEEFAESLTARTQIAEIVDDLIKAREGVTDGKWEAIERVVELAPETIENWLDERFTRDVLIEVPEYVQRTLQLSRMKCTMLPSKVTNGYLREAVRTYILGLPQASVALSRAALEQALKEGIGYQSTGTFIQMNELLNEAETADVIDHANRELARQVADAADDVLHEMPTTLSAALDVLVKMRGVLQFIYSRE